MIHKVTVSVRDLFRVSGKEKKHNSIHSGSGRWIQNEGPCVDGIFALFLTVSSFKSSTNLDLQRKSIRIRSTQSDMIVTEKIWLYQLQRISRKRASSVNLYISAQKGRLMKEKPQRGWLYMRWEWNDWCGDQFADWNYCCRMFRKRVRELKRNYKDPNHRLASLNGSAYSDSLYNEGDSNSIVRIAVY